MRSFLLSHQPRWQVALEMLVLGFVLALGGGVAFIYSGIFDVAATHRHWPFTEWVFETARTRSIKAHAKGIQAPPDLNDEKKLVIGTEHFAAHCAVCHGAPGVGKGDIAHGLYPAPPDLRHTATRLTDGEMFWVIKNGIKMTGMPAWADHKDDEIWATVAFIKKLPTMSEDDYAKLIMATMGHGGHRHSDDGAKPGDAPPAGHTEAPARDGHRH